MSLTPIVENLMFILIFFAFLIYPVLATIYEVLLVFLPRRHAAFRNIHDLFLLLYGWALTVTLMNLLGTWLSETGVSMMKSDRLLCAPVNMACRPSFYTFLIIGYVGLIAIRIMEVTKINAILAVLSMAAMYLSVIVLWALTIQSKDQIDSPILMSLLPLSSLAITIRAVKDTINGYRLKTNLETIRIFGKEYELICIPLLAVLGAIALYFALTLILMLFGQPFNGLIHSFRDTIGHTFSIR